MTIEPYILLAFLSAVLFGLFSVSIKFFVRYRLCNPVLVTIGYCIANGFLSLLLIFFIDHNFKAEFIPLFILVSVTILTAHLFFAVAMQEGDVSTVVPLLGLKIPFTAILAFFILGETFSSSVYVAVFIAAAAVVLFGLGKPAQAMGGHNKHPVFSIILATVSALLYSISDIYAKKLLIHLTPFELILWMNIAISFPCLGLFFLPVFKKYKIRAIDYLGFIVCAVLLIGGILVFYTSIQSSGNVTIPNIILATRGFIVLLIGFSLNKLLSISIERQSNRIYIFRLIATCMLFFSLMIILTKA